MKAFQRRYILFVMLGLLGLSGCTQNKLDEKYKAQAKDLAEARNLVVTYTSNGTIIGTVSGPTCSPSDLSIDVKGLTAAGTPKDWRLEVEKSNSQWVDLYSLRKGDQVSFEFVDAKANNSCDIAKYVRLRR